MQKSKYCVLIFKYTFDSPSRERGAMMKMKMMKMMKMKNIYNLYIWIYTVKLHEIYHNNNPNKFMTQILHFSDFI